MSPVIGITSAHMEEEIATYPRQFYVEAVRNAGATPLLLPISDENPQKYLPILDGVILSGGSDVGARYFNEEPLRGGGRVYPERDKFELSLARDCVAGHKPLLGICRGMQVLNIAAGGDIYQDLHTQLSGTLDHSQKAPRYSTWHSIKVIAGSRLERIWGVEECLVNSFHHQAVRTVAPGFKVAAIAKDGVIEAIELDNNSFSLGVQWHPEALVEDEFSRKIFQEFIKACSK